MSRSFKMDCCVAVAMIGIFCLQIIIIRDNAAMADALKSTKLKLVELEQQFNMPQIIQLTDEDLRGISVIEKQLNAEDENQREIDNFYRKAIGDLMQQMDAKEKRLR